MQDIETTGPVALNLGKEGPRRRASVLLVDDREENLIALESILKDLGQDLVRARSGQEALRLVFDRDFAVILLDVRMPEMDGFEAAELIRKRQKSRHTPIIFITAADASPDDIARGYSVGAVDYIFKPFMPEVLKAKIQIFLDLHEKREELRQSEERFRLMVERVRDYAIFMLDPEGRIVSWNEGAERIKGYRAEEIIGEHLSRFYTPEDVERGRPRELLNVAETRGAVEDEGWRVRKDGQRFWADGVITALRDSEGKLRGFGKVTRDLTERKKTEEALRERTAQLQAANSELEAFCYSVSHDLRAPLRGIDGFSKVALSHYGEKLGAQGRNLLERVRAGSQRMAELIDDLLNLSRLTRSQIRPQKVDLANLAREVAADLARTQPGRQVEFVIPSAIAAVGDPRLLRVVLENLLGNAWKFTGKRGSARIEVGVKRQDGKVVYFVRDDGAGFDPAYAHKLFGAFQRLHSAREFEGTGIGLATVQRIIRRHGGEAWAEGAVNQGATFSFTL